MKRKLRVRDLPDDGLTFDLRRRYQNAVLALALSDPAWMIWLEKNIPPQGGVDRCELHLIESRARALVVKNYRFAFSHSQQISIIFGNMPFTDRGELRQC